MTTKTTTNKETTGVKVVFSNTHDLNDYHVEHISIQLFEELEKKRNGHTWAVLNESPKGSGYYETYHGPH